MTQGQAALLMREINEIKGLLLQQVNTKPSHLTVKEFAKASGLGVSTVTLYLNKGKLSGEKLGGQTSPWRIPYQELERINGLDAS